MSFTDISPDNAPAINQWQQEGSLDTDEPSLTTTWGHEGPRYEYTGDEDASSGLAPRDEVLEAMLFAPEARPTKGINFAKYEGIHVDLEVTNDVHTSFKPIKTFAEAALHPAMQLNISLCGYTTPTPIQAYSIPCLLAGNDLLAGAQTGSGKTAAFLIPIISKLMGKAKKIQQPRKLPLQRAEPLVLIIAPTRELATQIFDECRRYCYRSMLRPCVVYGGAHLRSQMEELQRGCDVLVASPGRLQGFLRRGTIALSRVRFVVLDEADRMLAMSPEVVRSVLSSSDLPNDDSLQICMYSATFPRQVRELAKDFLSDYFVNIRVGRLGSTTTDITQRVDFVDQNGKQEHLLQLLLDQPPTRTVIFVNSKRQCDTLDDFLYSNKLPVTSIHGDRTQREREDAIASFRSGINPILVATDVAARGIDIKGVMHVVNYDCPFTIEEYVHRIGRTARIGNMGLATTFYNEEARELAPDLVRILLENEQSIPDFLEEHLPEGPLSFDEADLEAKPKFDNEDW